MSTKEQSLFAFLLDPASCRIYSNETRQRHAAEIPQTAAEARAAAKLHGPIAHLTRPGAEEERIARVEAGLARQRAERAYRSPVTPRTPEETLALLGKLARKGARPDYLRTDPWEGIDVNPWRITEKERIRFGLGPFR